MWEFWLHRSVLPLFHSNHELDLIGQKGKRIKLWAIGEYSFFVFSFNFGLYIRANPLSTLPASHLLIGGYKGRGKEGLGLRGGLVSKVLESRTKS